MARVQLGNRKRQRKPKTLLSDDSNSDTQMKESVFDYLSSARGLLALSRTMNVEVTVTGQRGWVNETDRELAADMSVVGKIWFSPSALQNPIVKLLWSHFEKSKQPFPFRKSSAIVVYTHRVGQADQPIFPLLKAKVAILIFLILPNIHRQV